MLQTNSSRLLEPGAIGSEGKGQVYRVTGGTVGLNRGWVLAQDDDEEDDLDDVDDEDNEDDDEDGEEGEDPPGWSD